MFKKQREHIQDLYTRKAKNDENSTTLARTLELNILTGLKGEHKFIFELLQNSDDSANDDNPIETSFIVKNIKSNNRNYLVFTHTGTFFSDTDVEKICDNGQQSFQDKSRNKRKIGYKGIGFKAVFSVADCVHIISGGYNFRFDRNYFLQRNEPKKAYPWQIIPVPNESDDIPQELKEFIQTDRVVFILQIKPDIQIENELEYIKSNQSLLLFLRNVKSVTLVNKEITVKIDVVKEDKIKKIFMNGKFVEAWFMHEYIFDIPASPTYNIRGFLNSLEDSECPQRLKTAQDTQITFAAQIDTNGNIISNDKGPLFCYLPTQVKCGFPYLVNGDFLLNPERTRLIDNKWNEFLMLQIGYYQIEFLQILTKYKEYQLQILKLLGPMQIIGLSSVLEKEYKRGFQIALKEIAFIPAEKTPGSLLRVNEVVVDLTGFFSGIATFEFSEGKLISNALHSLSILMELFSPGKSAQEIKMARIIEIQDVLNYLPQLSQQYPTLEFQRYMLNFLSKYSAAFLAQKLIGISFILSEQNSVYSPESIYLPSPEIVKVPLIGGINLVHPNLLEFQPFLKSIGVRLATRIEFIRGTIKRFILENLMSRDQVLPITFLVFEGFQANELDRNDWTFLRKLPIKTKSGSFKMTHQCYLSDIYNPKNLLETILDSVDIFVSDEYIVNGSSKEWKVFFERIGVKSEVKVYNNRKLLRKDAIAEKSYMKAYLNYLQQEGSSPQKAMSEEVMAEHYIENFVDIDLIEYAAHERFSDLFWERLINAWQDIKAYSTDTNYHLSRKSNSIQKTYLQFCLEQAVGTPSNQIGFFTTRQLFMPSLYEIIGDALPVARIHVSLTEEQAKFFGFKTMLSIEDCLHILNSINQSTRSTDPSRYVPVLRYLLRLSLTDESVVKIKKWNGFLLAQDNTIQPIRLLQYCALMVEPPKRSTWLKSLPGILGDEMLKIAQLFNISIVGQDAVVISMTSENPNESCLAKELVFSKLPLMALVEANFKNQSSVELLRFLSVKFNELQFISVNRLSIEMNGVSKPITAHIKGNVFYFEKRHDQKRTRHEFCKKLGIYLGLTEMSIQELHTYLYLDDLTEIEEYLRGLDTDPTQLPKIEQMLSTSTNNSATTIETQLKKVQAELQDLAIKDDGLQEEDMRRAHKPATDHDNEKKKQGVTYKESDEKSVLSKAFVELTTLDVPAIRMEKIKLQPKARHSTTGSSNQTEPTTYGGEEIEYELSREQRQKIGRLGENIVYHKLIHHYKQKYPNCTFDETTQGFKLSGKHINKRTKMVEPLELEVIWYNKGLPANQDLGGGKDITIKKNGNTRHIEVKATPSDKKGIFKLTANEWSIMQEFTNQYRIFRVYGVGTKEVSIKTIKNPADAIQTGNIEVKSYELKI